MTKVLKQAFRFAVWLGLPLLREAGALSPQLRISQYQKQYWQVEQGLPHGYVSAVAQSRDGYLLIGTDEGLARFDGLMFKPVHAERETRLSQRWISALLAARDGSVWAGTFDGLLVRLKDGHVDAKHQISGTFFDLTEDGQGVIWASTRDGVFRIDGSRLVAVPLAAPSETSWNVFTLGQRGELWVVTSGGLFERRESKFVKRLEAKGKYGEILTVLAGRKRGMWLGTSRGLFRLAPAGNHEPERLTGVAGPVVALHEDRDGTLWAGTWGKGLFRVNGPSVAGWCARDGLPDDFIRTLAEDSEGNLWMGMRSGLGRWRETRLIPLGMPEGLASNYASTVAADPSGNLWLGTWRGGLYRLKDGQLEGQPVPLPTLYFTVRALAFDRQGRQWIGNWEGLFRFDGHGYQRFASEPGSPCRRVSALLFDRAGGLWAGTSGNGLFHFPSGLPSEPVPAAILPGTEITALLEDSGGSIWVGTSGGLRKIARPQQSGSAAELPGAPADAVESLFEDSSNRVWAATAAGQLVVAAPGGVNVFDKRNGLPDHAFYRVLEDPSGNFWVSSPRGVLEIHKEALEAVLAGRRKSLDVLTYGIDDGMRTIECHGLSQPAGWRARDGSLWFPTAKGFVQVRPVEPRAQAAPRVTIEEVAADWGWAPLSARLDLRPGTRNLEIRYTALRLGSPGQVRFRYRLRGFDPDWVDAGVVRSARYNQLPPGEYVFELQARDPSGVWGEAAALSLRQLPRFHQTAWFIFLASLALVVAAGGAHRWRLRAIRGRYAAVLEERNRIGSEWHDTLVAGFSAISLQLEAALAKIERHPERASEILEMTRKMVHHYRAEARRVIWDLRDNRPEGETLPAAIEEALSRVTGNRGIERSVKVGGEPVELPPEVKHNLLRICQEAMSNSVMHGNPSRIDVELDYSSDRLKVRVSDDGCGFLPSAHAEPAGHFGLTVMRERARRHGGRLTVASQPGHGTVVEATVPLGRWRAK